MKWTKKVPVLLLSALMVGAAVLPASAAFQQGVLDGIVLIRSGAPDADGTMTYWRGTGFFVGEEGQDPEYIVTNCHVVEEFITIPGRSPGEPGERNQEKRELKVPLPSLLCRFQASA